jgi:hypothetical protein
LLGVRLGVVLPLADREFLGLDLSASSRKDRYHTARHEKSSAHI